MQGFKSVMVNHQSKEESVELVDEKEVHDYPEHSLVSSGNQFISTHEDQELQPVSIGSESTDQMA